MALGSKVCLRGGTIRFSVTTEITDVANAVLDGTDAVMLSGETSVGAHPVKVVEAMNKIIFETEKSYEIDGKRPKASEDSPTYLSDKICLTASKLAEEIDAEGLIGCSPHPDYKVATIVYELLFVLPGPFFREGAHCSEESSRVRALF